MNLQDGTFSTMLEYKSIFLDRQHTKGIWECEKPARSLQFIAAKVHLSPIVQCVATFGEGFPDLTGRGLIFLLALKKKTAPAWSL